MTESEWLTATDPRLMLDFLDGRPDGYIRPGNSRLPGVSDRKLRLFMCGYCRRIWGLLTDIRSRRAVETAELFVDGNCDVDQLKHAEELANQAERTYDSAAYAASSTVESDAFGAAIEGFVSASCAVRLPAWRDRDYESEVAHFASMTTDEVHSAIHSPGPKAARLAERESQTCLLRCIFGNPFRPVTLDPRWRSETVVSLANSIYTERAFDRMPILADALEEAGCDHADILAHCRGDGPHVRGCWVVDLVLGKS